MAFGKQTMSSPIDPSTGSGGDPSDPSVSSIAVAAEDVGEVTEMMDDAVIMDEDDDDEGDDEVVDMGEEDEEEDEDMMSMLPPKVRRRVEKLKDLNTVREGIMEEYLKERAALENKYGDLCRPLYAQRLDIIKGVMDAAIAAEKPTDAIPTGDDNEVEAEGENGAVTVGVPQFWVCAMGHMETVAELVTERDVDCLEHLVNVTCDDFEDGHGFTLRFHFEPNDYFENEVLTKTYEIPNLLLDDEPILKNVSGCVIHWKQDDDDTAAPTTGRRCLTHTRVQKRQRSRKGKNAGQIRTVTKNERTDSFFHFFNPPKMPAMEDMDEDEADAIEEAFDHDYDVAQAFRSHLVPKGVLWFTGEALDEELNAALDDDNATMTTNATGERGVGGDDDNDDDDLGASNSDGGDNAQTASTFPTA